MTDEEIVQVIAKHTFEFNRLVSIAHTKGIEVRIDNVDITNLEKPLVRHLLLVTSCYKPLNDNN